MKQRNNKNQLCNDNVKYYINKDLLISGFYVSWNFQTNLLKPIVSTINDLNSRNLQWDMGKYILISHPIHKVFKVRFRKLVLCEHKGVVRTFT